MSFHQCQWNDFQSRLVSCLHKGDKPAPPFRNAWFRYELAEHGPAQTQFTASLKYEMPWGSVGNWLGARMKSVVQATISDVATSMKLYYETGVPTTKSALKAFKSRVK